MLGLTVKRVSSVQAGTRRTGPVCQVGGQPFSDDGARTSAIRLTGKTGKKIPFTHKSTTSSLNGHAVITDDALGLVGEQEEILADRLEHEYVYGLEHGDMARSTRAVVLAGGETNTPLTKFRAMPAVPEAADPDHATGAA